MTCLAVGLVVIGIIVAICIGACCCKRCRGSNDRHQQNSVPLTDVGAATSDALFLH